MGNAVRQLEYRASNKNVARLEQTIQQLQQDLRDRDASIQQLTADLKEGASVEMPAEQQHLVSRVLEETLAELGLSSPVEAQESVSGSNTSPKAVKRKSSQGLKRLETATRVALVAASQAAREAAAKAEALKTPEERLAEDMAAMPNWSMDAWLASLDMQSIVCNSILNHVRGAGGKVNAQVELLFMQKLGAIGSRDTVLALLRASTVLNDITDKLWQGICDLYKEVQEEQLMFEKKKKEEAEEAVKEAELEADRETYAKLLEEEAERDLKEWEANEVKAEERRQEERKERQEKSIAAAIAAETERKELREMVETTRTEAEQVRVELDEAEQKSTEHGSDGDLELTEQEADNIRKLQEQLHALEAKAQEATERAKQAEEREQLRIIKEQEKEVQLEKKAQEEKAEAEKKKPKPKKAWGQMGKKAAAKSSKPASVAKKPSASIDTKYVHDHIKVSTKAFELSYGTPEVWFRGLSRIIGRAGAGAGEDEALMALMSTEHCAGPDSQLTFEPPNFLIPTSSEIEWHAVVDPEGGLETLGLREWPKEQRSPSQRQLLPPRAFREQWDKMNARLEHVGEPPLQLHGFCCLRLYTGPMYFKYNTVLRGVTIPGCKAPLEAKFEALCVGNKYTNTIHSISAAIGKLSRVSVASTVYRAPGGCLPKHFWDDDDAGIKGGVEMGFMSTSTSKEAATEYAKMSGVKLLFELKQGMVARGADISWLSMYPNENEILFAPLTACEVQKTRVEGSMLVVELRPGAAPATLMEKSIEEKVEDARMAEEQAAKDAVERKRAIEEVANRRARWMNSMSGLQVAVADAKVSQSELATARAEAATASAADRAEKAEAEAMATAKNLKAMNQLKAMEKEEREAAERRRQAELDAKDRLQKAREMAEYIKKAALQERLKQEQQALRDLLAANEREREEQEAAREQLTARAFRSSLSAVSIKMKAEEGGATLMEEAERKLQEAEKRFQELLDANNELKEKLDKAVARAREAERSGEKLQATFAKANDDFKIEEVSTIMDKKDPIEMQEKLEGWLSDPLTARATTERITQMMKKNKKDNQKKFESIGAIEKAVRAMSSHRSVNAMEAVCTALSAITGSVSAGKKAADAGAIPVVVRTVKELQRSGLKALLNIVSTDPALMDMARQAGAKEEWLLPPAEGEDNPLSSP